MSRTLEAERIDGVELDPELLPRTTLLPMLGNCANVTDPAISAKLGWLDVNVPAVDKLLNHWLAVAFIALTHPNVANPEAGHCVGAIVPLISENAG
jgi:hypothetical protein